ncbi:hypothetical protein FRB99_001725 [Tulasnella sp. 403]|nr:hypothetical protein FRB99_001725 [Tulasnella sp. 403]
MKRQAHPGPLWSTTPGFDFASAYVIGLALSGTADDSPTAAESSTLGRVDAQQVALVEKSSLTPNTNSSAPHNAQIGEVYATLVTMGSVIPRAGNVAKSYHVLQGDGDSHFKMDCDSDRTASDSYFKGMEEYLLEDNIAVGREVVRQSRIAVARQPPWNARVKSVGPDYNQQSRRRSSLPFSRRLMADTTLQDAQATAMPTAKPLDQPIPMSFPAFLRNGANPGLGDKQPLGVTERQNDRERKMLFKDGVRVGKQWSRRRDNGKYRRFGISSQSAR